MSEKKFHWDHKNNRCILEQIQIENFSYARGLLRRNEDGGQLGAVSEGVRRYRRK